jgi:transposase
MSKQALTAKRQYTDEFKHEAVKLAQSVGGNQAARRLDIPDSSLGNWLRLSRKDKLKAVEVHPIAVKRSVTDLEAENTGLRRQLANARADLEIVKKAAAYFARESR